MGIAADLAGKNRVLDIDDDRLVQSLISKLSHILEDVGELTARIFVNRQEGNFAATQHRIRVLAKMESFAETLAKAMAFADIQGRVRVIRNLKEQSQLFSRFNYDRFDDDLPAFLDQPFEEAIAELTAREPILAQSASEITAAYLRQKFALARSTAIEFTQKVQRGLIAVQRVGGNLADFIQTFRREGLSDAYAETVFRTNIKNATTAGRIQMANTPALADFIVAFKYFAVTDDDVRTNHKHMHKRMYRRTSAVWSIWSPPNGYNCRCSLVEITRPQAERLGRIDEAGNFVESPPPSQRPDPGFENSPALRIY